jgi:hypothetical protein
LKRASKCRFSARFPAHLPPESPVEALISDPALTFRPAGRLEISAIAAKRARQPLLTSPYHVP